MLITEMRSECLKILNAVDGAIDESATYVTGIDSEDEKWSNDHVESFLKNAIAEVAALVIQAGRKDELFLFCDRVADLAGTEAGKYIIDKTVITGPIVQVENTYDTVAPYTDYQYSEPDSATAIRRYRRRRTAGALTLELYSYAIEGDSIFYPGNKIAVIFVPDDVGADEGDEIPRQYANAIVAIALSYLFAYDGANSYVNAAQYFASLASQARQMILAGKVDLIPMPQVPYQGS